MYPRPYSNFFHIFFYIKISILRNRKLNASQITAKLDVLDEYPDIPSDSDISGCSYDSFDDESWNPESWQNRGIRPGNSCKKNQEGSQGDPPRTSSYVPEPPARVAKFPVRVGGDQEDEEDGRILDISSISSQDTEEDEVIYYGTCSQTGAYSAISLQGGGGGQDSGGGHIRATIGKVNIK